MLTSQDDLLGHQTAAPFAVAGGGDPRFTERYWFSAHPIDGTPLIIDLGLGYYPNKGVMDGFAGVTVGARQHNFRASRRLGNNPLVPEVGPLRFEVLDGLKRHRMTLADNGSGISFDIEFEASFPAVQEKQSYRAKDGVVQEDLTRVAQMGRYSGWLVVEGQRHVIEPSLWWGQRDHSWGQRSEMRTDETRPPLAVNKNFFWTWTMFQFDDMAITVFLKERDAGKPFYLSGTEMVRSADGSIQRREMTGVTHDFEWADDPLGQTATVANFRFEFDHGPVREVRMECLPTRFYLKAGMYGGFEGWNHGDDRGDYDSAHDVWDLTDAATRRKARTLSDHVHRATCEGKVGSGVSEYGVAEGYSRYPVPQRFPAF